MNKYKEWFKNKMLKKRNRILCRITISIVVMLLFVSWTTFVAKQYGNHTPIAAIKTQVKDGSFDKEYFTFDFIDSLFLEIEEVDDKTSHFILQDKQLDPNTHTVYCITKNIPHDSSGSWIVEEVKEEYQTYYIAKYYGF